MKNEEDRNGTNDETEVHRRVQGSGGGGSAEGPHHTAWTRVASPVPVAGNGAISKKVGPLPTCAATNHIIGYLGELRSGVATGASAFAGVATAPMMSPVGS